MTWLKKESARAAFGKIVEAAGLSRQVEHLSEGPFGILSASRGNLPPEKNRQHTLQLRQLTRQMGFGYIPAEGVWEGVSEDSLLIPGISQAQVRDLAAQFQQDAYVWGQDGSYTVFATADDSVIEQGNVKDRWQYLGKGDEADDANAYTEIGGRRWRFRPMTDSAVAQAGYRFVTKGRAWQFKPKQPSLEGGRPYFFVVDMKYVSPRYGFAAESEGKTHVDSRYLSAYLPIPEVELKH